MRVAGIKRDKFAAALAHTEKVDSESWFHDQLLADVLPLRRRGQADEVNEYSYPSDCCKNVRMQLLFNIAASLLICFDIFVLAPRPTLSLLGAGVSVKPRFRPGAKVWTGFALLLGGVICLSHIRMSAFLTMLGLCLLVLDRYRKTSPVSS
jgi:hypothetical protein